MNQLRMQIYVAADSELGKVLLAIPAGRARGRKLKSLAEQTIATVALVCEIRDGFSSIRKALSGLPVACSVPVKQRVVDSSTANLPEDVSIPATGGLPAAMFDQFET